MPKTMKDADIDFIALSIPASLITIRPLPSGKDFIRAINEHDSLQSIAEAARDLIWEPENWEAYQDSKTSDSVAWPPEFLLLAQAVEKKFGPMPIEED